MAGVDPAALDAAIRARCTAADVHLRCTWPDCGCKTQRAPMEAAILAYLAATPGARDRALTDKQMIAFARSFRRGILGRRKDTGMCFAVCAPLVGLLQGHGIECRLVEGHDVDEEFDIGRGWKNHCWLALPDGRVLDPTIRQFEPTAPTVYLGPPLTHHIRWDKVRVERGHD